MIRLLLVIVLSSCEAYEQPICKEVIYSCGFMDRWEIVECIDIYQNACVYRKGDHYYTTWIKDISAEECELINYTGIKGKP